MELIEFLATHKAYRDGIFDAYNLMREKFPSSQINMDTIQDPDNGEIQILIEVDSSNYNPDARKYFLQILKTSLPTTTLAIRDKIVFDLVRAL